MTEREFFFSCSSNFTRIFSTVADSNQLVTALNPPITRFINWSFGGGG